MKEAKMVKIATKPRTSLSSPKYIILYLLFFKCLKLIYANPNGPGLVPFPVHLLEQQSSPPHMFHQKSASSSSQNNQQVQQVQPNAAAAAAAATDWVKTVPKFTEETIGRASKILLFDNTSLNTGNQVHTHEVKNDTKYDIKSNTNKPTFFYSNF